MEAMLYRMRMAAMGFAALVVLGVLFFAEDAEVAEDTAPAGSLREPPVARSDARESGPPLGHEAMDSSGEFASDEDLIDNTEGFSTEGFDTRGIDTEGFEAGGFDSGGLAPAPDMDTAPEIDAAFEYAIVVDDGRGP